MRVRYAGFVAALLCAAFAPAVTAEWKEHSSQEGRFKVKFPAEPNKQTQPAAGFTMHILGVERDNGSEAFMVMYNDIPGAGELNDQLKEDMLKRCRDGVLQSSNGKVSKEKSVTVSGQKGLEFSFSGSSQGRDMEATWRIFIVKGRLYQVAVLRMGRAPAAEDVRQFLDSFKFTN